MCIQMNNRLLTNEVRIEKNRRNISHALALHTVKINDVQFFHLFIPIRIVLFVVSYYARKREEKSKIVFC